MIQSDYALLLLNLCVALVIANVIFLVGVNRTEPEVTQAKIPLMPDADIVIMLSSE